MAQSDLVAQESGSLLPQVVASPHQEIQARSLEAEPLPSPLALASPERSSMDLEHYKVSRSRGRGRTRGKSRSRGRSRTRMFCHVCPQMATNYLKAQFAIPHHTVPSLQVTRERTKRKVSLITWL